MLVALKIIFLLGFLVLIHESGHYLVAKICNIKVNEFAIGFGPIIWKKQGKETNYEIRLIPLGGFVNLEGEEEHSDMERSFNKASIPKRIAVIAAGAIVNIIFGIIVYFVLIFVRYSIVVGGNFTEILKYSAGATLQLIQLTVDGLVQLFTGKLSMDDMMGPVGISSVVAKTSGIVEFVYLLSIVSISLGVTNLLPFVPLDGGKIVLLIIEAIRRKPLKKEFEIKIQTIGFFILIIFSILVTFNDVIRIVK